MAILLEAARGTSGTKKKVEAIVSGSNIKITVPLKPAAKIIPITQSELGALRVKIVERDSLQSTIKHLTKTIEQEKNTLIVRLKDSKHQVENGSLDIKLDASTIAIDGRVNWKEIALKNVEGTILNKIINEQKLKIRTEERCQLRLFSDTGEVLI